jgi:hypothetical protein
MAMTNTTDTQKIIDSARKLAARGYAEGRRATSRLFAMASDHRAERFGELRRILNREGSSAEQRAYVDVYETELIRLSSD